MQIAETPIYNFQCATNNVCDHLLCDVDLFGNEMTAVIEMAIVHECGKASTYQLSISLGTIVLGTLSTNVTGVYDILGISLKITLDQMEDINAVGLEV